MKTIEQWFHLYQQSHRNPVNKGIHYLCVPVIFYATLGILDAVSQPNFLNLSVLSLPVSLGWVLVVLGGVFYLSLCSIVALLGTLCAVLCMLSFLLFPMTYQLWVCTGLFVVAWVLQLIGHKIEGRKPSFLNDLLFLLIGPLWILQEAKKLFYRG